MNCRICGQDNRAGKRFCTGCGTALASSCPACGHVVEPEERFCGDCGAPLQPNQASTGSPARAVAAAGERKQITVLFADVAGSMDLQERLDAEVWAQIMGRFVAILAEGVRKYGGTVDKFTGDGIMALFGAPVAQEDHARRACHGAWELTRTVGEFSEELRQTHGCELAVRLGLNSGEVVVGRVGEDVTLDPTALGHTVGLAQRMEALAEPGTAYLSEHTVRLVEGWFRLRNLGPITVKGVSEPVGVYVLEGPVSSPPVLHRAGGLGPAPLVGREGELAILEDALAMAERGHAQVVGVVGEAGVGKSRLCDDFARACAARGVMVRRTAGVSHGRDLPLLPVLALLRAYFGISESDGPDQARIKIAGRLLELDRDLEETLPLLFDLLEVPDPQRPAPRLAADIRMRRVFEALRRVTQRRSEQESLVLVFEDLHWFDPQSEAFLERLIESFPGSRTLVVTNFRPEFTAAWMRHSYYRQLPLAPLQEQAVGDLVGGLLGGDLSLDPLLGFVVERTGGNPFFVEEVVRTLVEGATLVKTDGTYRLTRALQDVVVPPSVQAVLAARIDRLEALEKQVLQTAAVIGTTFSPPILCRVAELNQHDLDSALAALRAGEFVLEESMSPVVRYRFWHPLTREVAYGSLLSQHRARLHAAVARALAEDDSARQDEHAALIAAHYERAGERLEAAIWVDRAAVWIFRRDVEAAIGRWRDVLDHLAVLPESEASLRLGVRARMQLIRMGARAGIPISETRAFHRDGRAIAQRLGDDELLILVEFAHGLDQYVRGDLEDSWATFRNAARLAIASDDRSLIAVTCVASLLASYVGPVSEGLWMAEQVERASVGDPEVGAQYLGYSPLVRTRHYKAELAALTGRLADAGPAAEEAMRGAHERQETEGAAWALAFKVRLAYLNGEPFDARAWAAEAVRLAEESGNRMLDVICLLGAGVAELAHGHYQGAVDPLRRALVIADEQHAGLSEKATLLAHLARAHLGSGHQHAARTCAQEAVLVAQRTGGRVLECFALMTRAQVGRLTSQSQHIVASDLEAAVALVGETGALAYEPFIHEELGRLHHDDKGLRDALRLYRQIGATGHARRLEAELSMGGTSRR